MSSSATSLLRSDEELDAGFRARIESALATVRAWESADRSLKESVRQSLPWETLRQPQLQTKDEVKDVADQITTHQISHSSLLFLHRLTKWFPTSMTWVNQPPCHVCGSVDHMQHAPSRGPETPDEIQGGASRVEVYTCTHCSSNTVTTFPRYNNVATLVRTRRGRCGEYANLFGFTCRCVGFEVRYILDVTDHVWIECWIPELQQWCMADGCEGLIQRNAMYEAGWGKSLSYVIAVAMDHVVDVTPRYTRKWHEDDFQTRRRNITSSEANGQAVIVSLQQKQQQTQSKDVVLRLQTERQELLQYQQTTSWTEQEKNGQGGRISGSWAWKVARQEVGTTSGRDAAGGDVAEATTNQHDATTTTKGYRSFQMESFYPPVTNTANEENKAVMVVTITIPSTATTTVLHGLINVSGTHCAVPNLIVTPDISIDDDNSFLSIVILDQDYPGCILQSRAFGSWELVAQFVNQIPSHRIVAMVGALYQSITSEAQETSSSNSNISSTNERNKIQAVPLSLEAAKMLQLRLGGFQPSTAAPGVLFIGQVDAHPSWTVCQSWPAITDHEDKGATTAKSKLVQVLLTIPSHMTSPEKAPRLRMELNTQPKSVATRLPDRFMPLSTQLQATAYEKHQAFMNFLQENRRFVGYTTKPQTPIYLIDGTAYPFWKDQHQLKQPTGSGEGWNTFHLLPPALVPDQHELFPMEAAPTAAAAPQFDIPMDTNFFLNLLGPTLLASGNSLHHHHAQPQQLPTLEALSNCRLIGLYFSAHWCGPCRSFTPMLAESFLHLQEEANANHAHGLQIVFVSSDRDESSFQHYFGTMPWLALPFDPRRKQEISQRYGVSGIPSLIILDAVSGQIVVNATQSRGEVVHACQGGDDRIGLMWKNWLTRVPPETSEILAMLELSCVEDNQASSNDKDEHREQDDPYLIRNIEPTPAPSSTAKVDPAERVKQLFADLVQGGLDANTAAAKAIQQVAEERKATSNNTSTQQKFDVGPLDQLGKRLDVVETVRAELLKQAVNNVTEWNESGKDAAKIVLTTILKYVENVHKEPWTPKFRSFKLSNKVADRICSVSGGLDLIRILGLELFGTSQDFMACVPLSTDLEALHGELDGLLNGLEQHTA